MLWLKQSTAVVISFGPFLDKSDGVTLKADATTITDIDHATTGIFLSKNGGNAAIRHQNVTASVADDYGMMRVTLDATDTNTLGYLRMMFAKASTYLPVWQDFMVVPSNVWDSMFGTDYLQVDNTQILGTDISAPATAGILDVNLKNIANAAVSTSTAQLGINVVNWKGSAAPAMTGDAYASLANGGFTDLLIDSIISELAKVPKSDSTVTFNATALASIKTQAAAVFTDANTELASVPASTAGIGAMIQFIFESIRHKFTENKDTGAGTLYKDDGSTPLGTRTDTDDGTTVTRGEMT